MASRRAVLSKESKDRSRPGRAGGNVLLLDGVDVVILLLHIGLESIYILLYGTVQDCAAL